MGCLLVLSPDTKSQTPELVLDRIDEARLDLLASQTAQKIREMTAGETGTSVMVIDFFRNSTGTTSRLGSLLADRFSESLSVYSGGLKIIDRKILRDYLIREWTTLNNLNSNEVCLRLGRQLGATGVILGTLTNEKDSVRLTLKIEGLGPEAKMDEVFPWRARTADFLLNEETHQMLLQPGPDYSRKADDIPEEYGVLRAGLSGVTVPACLYCPNPDYPDSARVAKAQGTVVLSVVVTPEGNATSIYVVKGAPLGLTAQAVQAARRWRFRPGEKDGKPVPVRVQVEAIFRLYQSE